MADQPSVASRISKNMGQGMPPLQAAKGAYNEVGAAPQMSQAEANYRPAEGPEQSCGTCQHFTGDACEVVQGKIDAGHVSDSYLPVEAEPMPAPAMAGSASPPMMGGAM